MEPGMFLCIVLSALLEKHAAGLLGMPLTSHFPHCLHICLCLLIRNTETKVTLKLEFRDKFQFSFFQIELSCIYNNSDLKMHYIVS